MQIPLLQMQQAVKEIHVSSALLDYLQALIHFTRTAEEYPVGLSPRAGLALLGAAKAWAYMQQRDAVIPEDVQAVLASVTGHRLRASQSNSAQIVAPLLANVAIP